MHEERLNQLRYFLKDTVRKEINFRQTDQSKGIKAPAAQKTVNEDSRVISLPTEDEWQIPLKDITEAIGNRRSHRKYRDESMTLDELSYLLWATQGVRKNNDTKKSYRNVPSAGCRHSFETYLAVFNIGGIEKGIYRYLPLSHSIAYEISSDNIEAEITMASFNQPYPANSAVTFIWTTIPYRMEWRYSIAAHKVILLDAGHVCQNLYLACEAIGAGTCAIAAYDQELMDKFIGVDGENEFTVYLAPVGRVR